MKKIKVITYTEQRSIYSASNYYGVSWPTIRFWIKGKDELMQVTSKMITVTLYKVVNKNSSTWSRNS